MKAYLVSDELAEDFESLLSLAKEGAEFGEHEKTPGETECLALIDRMLVHDAEVVREWPAGKPHYETLAEAVAAVCCTANQAVSTVKGEEVEA